MWDSQGRGTYRGEHRLSRILLRPPVVFGLIVVALALPAYVAYHLYTHHGIQRVKRAIDWDRSCHVVVRDGARFVYAERWRGLEDAATVTCEHLGPAAFYARFHDDSALRHTLHASPPLDPYCLYGDDELAIGLLDTPTEFEAVCSDLDCRLRPPPADADARLRRVLRERRSREDDRDSQTESHH